MRQRILNFIRRIIGTEFYRRSYSQDGEDAVLASFYESKGADYKGFYIDIGAHHPKRFSNTQFFYERGWSGINIDATSGSMKSFMKERKRDINIEAGVSDKHDEFEYYLFDEAALNSFDVKLSEQRIKDGWSLKERRKVKVFPINYLLNKYVPTHIKHIDFMSIDIEGMEYTILKSMDFLNYAPDFLLVEDLELNDDILECSKSLIYQFLKGKGYSIIAKTQRTFIYRLCS
jgi:FkbM family methyltransferase